MSLEQFFKQSVRITNNSGKKTAKSETKENDGSLWCDSMRPRRLKEYIGRTRTFFKSGKQWAKSWAEKKPLAPLLLWSQRSGSGKTCFAEILGGCDGIGYTTEPLIASLSTLCGGTGSNSAQSLHDKVEMMAGQQAHCLIIMKGIDRLNGTLRVAHTIRKIKKRTKRTEKTNSGVTATVRKMTVAEWLKDLAKRKTIPIVFIANDKKKAGAKILIASKVCWKVCEVTPVKQDEMVKFVSNLAKLAKKNSPAKKTPDAKLVKSMIEDVVVRMGEDVRRVLTTVQFILMTNRNDKTLKRYKNTFRTKADKKHAEHNNGEDDINYAIYNKSLCLREFFNANYGSAKRRKILNASAESIDRDVEGTWPKVTKDNDVEECARLLSDRDLFLYSSVPSDTGSSSSFADELLIYLPTNKERSKKKPLRPYFFNPYMNRGKKKWRTLENFAEQQSV